MAESLAFPSAWGAFLTMGIACVSNGLPTVASCPKSIYCLVGGLFRRRTIYLHVRRSAYISANALIGEPDGTNQRRLMLIVSNSQTEPNTRSSSASPWLHHSPAYSRGLIKKANVMKNMPAYGENHRYIMPTNPQGATYSSTWFLGLEGVETHPWMHVVRIARVARLGPFRGGVD